MSTVVPWTCRNVFVSVSQLCVSLGLESIVDKALIDSVDMTLRVWKDLLCSASFPVVGSQVAAVKGGDFGIKGGDFGNTQTFKGTVKAFNDCIYLSLSEVFA